MKSKIPPKFKILGVVFLWFALTFYAIVFSITNLKLLDLYDLVDNGVETRGQVTNKVFEEHRRIEYNFVVSGVEYKWRGFAADIDKEFDEVRLGEKIPVYYNPNNPNISTMGNPSNTLNPNLRLGVFVSLIPTLSLMILMVAHFVKHEREKL